MSCQLRCGSRYCDANRRGCAEYVYKGKKTFVRVNTPISGIIHLPDSVKRVYLTFYKYKYPTNDLCMLIQSNVVVKINSETCAPNFTAATTSSKTTRMTSKMTGTVVRTSGTRKTIGTTSKTTGASKTTAVTSQTAGTTSKTTGASKTTAMTSQTAGTTSKTTGANNTTAMTSQTAGMTSKTTGSSKTSAMTSQMTGTTEETTGMTGNATETSVNMSTSKVGKMEGAANNVHLKETGNQFYIYFFLKLIIYCVVIQIYIYTFFCHN